MPPGCLSTAQIEARYVAIADDLAARIDRLDPEGARTYRGVRDGAGLDYHVANTVAKLTAEQIKALRQAGEYAKRREDQAEVRRLERREREMLRGASH